LGYLICGRSGVCAKKPETSMLEFGVSEPAKFKFDTNCSESATSGAPLEELFFDKEVN